MNLNPSKAYRLSSDPVTSTHCNIFLPVSRKEKPGPWIGYCRLNRAAFYSKISLFNFVSGTTIQIQYEVNLVVEGVKGQVDNPLGFFLTWICHAWIKIKRLDMFHLKFYYLPCSRTLLVVLALKMMMMKLHAQIYWRFGPCLLGFETKYTIWTRKSS